MWNLGSKEGTTLRNCEGDPITMTCEFCSEFSDYGHSRFGRIYRGYATGRIVARTASFVAIPTMGQLFPGSLLVVPTNHLENFAQLDEEHHEIVGQFIVRLMHAVSRWGTPVVFEHGSTRTRGGGCGIYHAHLHMVPVPSAVHTGDLLPSSAETSPSLTQAFQALRGSDEYLVVLDTSGCVRHVDLRWDRASGFPSQYIRRRLVDHFGLKRSWDWKKYQYVEPHLLETLAKFPHPNATIPLP